MRHARVRATAGDDLVVQALFEMGVALGQFGRAEQAIAAYDEVLARYAGAAEPSLRERAATALFNSAVELAQLGRHEESLAAYQEVVARYADAPEPGLRAHVAGALRNTGLRLTRLDRAEGTLGEQVAMALFNRATRSGNWTALRKRSPPTTKSSSATPTLPNQCCATRPPPRSSTRASRFLSSIESRSGGRLQRNSSHAYARGRAAGENRQRHSSAGASPSAT